MAASPNSKSGAYPIGKAGQPWGTAERVEWFRSTTVVRSYAEDVIAKLQLLKAQFIVEEYGALSVDKERYPLYAVRSREWSPHKPNVLVTGGVHGYEKSGVQGALLFLQTKAAAYSSAFNVCVCPCVSPWGYETIQRWNAQAIDPNRSFNPNGERVEGRSFNPEAATEESAALLRHLESLVKGSTTSAVTGGGEVGGDAPRPAPKWLAHFDLHETTDTDESEFMPAKAARDGLPCAPSTIPDGFYLVADGTNPQTAWQKAMIDGVSKVTHIAPPDADGLIIDEPVLQHGVVGIPWPPATIGLCAGVTDTLFATTTEVYPDSPLADEEQCNRAQVAAIAAGLDHLVEHHLPKPMSAREAYPVCM